MIFPRLHLSPTPNSQALTALPIGSTPVALLEPEFTPLDEVVVTIDYARLTEIRSNGCDGLQRTDCKRL